MQSDTYKAFTVRRCCAVLTGLMGSMLMGTPVQAITLSIEPPAQTVSVGSPFAVNLQIAGLGDAAAPSLGAFDFNLLFDASVLSYDSTTFGDPGLGDQLGPIVGSVSVPTLNPPGSLNLASLSLDTPGDLDSLQAGQFILATVHFSAAAAGSSPLDLSSIVLGDSQGAPLTADLVQGASVNVVQPIPEGSLAAPGLFLLAFTAGCVRWQRRHLAGAF